MSFRPPRHSKFKHVFGTASKKDKCYDNIELSKSPWESNKSDVNGKFIALILEARGGGSFVAIPLNRTGRLHHEYPKVNGHKNPILDLAFNPFDDNIIATASEDCTVKIWEIPDNGLTENMEVPLLSLEAHSRKVGAISWHPTADNVLASGSADCNVIIWNAETGEELITLSDIHSDHVMSLSWNYNGSRLLTTCKDKMVRVIDPRSSAVMTEGKCHDGQKPTRATFCGTLDYIFTTGFSQSSDRQYSLFPASNLKNALASENIDSASGVQACFYDESTNLVYLVGKGDTTIRYFEVFGESPYVQYMSMYQSTNAQSGACSMLKRYLNYMDCEIMRFYKVQNSKGLVEPISMTVPRKSGMFQDDIFPPCNAGVPSLTADKWMSGQDKPPVLIEITKDGLGSTVGGQAIVLSSAPAPGKLSKQSSHSSTASSGRGHTPEREPSPTLVLMSSSLTSSGNHELEEENRKLRSEIQELKAENQRLKSEVTSKNDVMRQIKKLVQS